MISAGGQFVMQSMIGCQRSKYGNHWLKFGSACADRGRMVVVAVNSNAADHKRRFNKRTKLVTPDFGTDGPRGGVGGQ